MKVDELEKIINNAFEDRLNVSETSDKKILDAINETISPSSYCVPSEYKKLEFRSLGSYNDIQKAFEEF